MAKKMAADIEAPKVPVPVTTPAHLLRARRRAASMQLRQVMESLADALRMCLRVIDVPEEEDE